MPISPILLQRRHAELGRIRLGDKGTKGQPQKLTQFRITSPSERHIRDIATLYGGEARPWRNGNRDEWEVYTEAKSIPVIVVKGGISQWLETWSGGGCIHRCDGVENALTGEQCDPDDPQHQAAKPTTRLSVMLRDLDALGVWRLESHGWNSAAELPGLVELAMHVADLVPAHLYLAERISVKDGRTNRFIVPGLDLEVSPGRLAAIVSGQVQAPAVGGAQQREAIGAARHHEEPRDWLVEVRDATTEGELEALWNQAKEAGAPNEVAVEIRARVAEIQEANRDRDVERFVEVQQQANADDVWFAVMAAAGKQGMNTADVEADAEAFLGKPAKDADAGELGRYLEHLKTAPVSS